MTKRPGPGPDEIDADLLAPDEPGELPPARPALTDELDLHTFLPRDCADVVTEYLEAAREAGLSSVRIVHGKGTGELRRTVHAVLERHPAVRSYQLGSERSGGWGATLVALKPRLT